MKPQMKLVIQDAALGVVNDVKVALAKEKFERGQLVTKWINQGHAVIVEDCNPAAIIMRIEEETFSCERERYPTIELVARMQLAIHAGLSCRNGNFDSDGANHYVVDAMSYSAMVHARLTYPRRGHPEISWYEEPAPLASHPGPVKRLVTATVKRAKNLMKGRP